MIHRLPFHCFLLGIFPVLCAFSSLINYLLPEELIIPILVSIVLAGLILVVSNLALKNLTKAGAVTSAIILLIFCFDTVSIVANKLLGAFGLTGDDRLYLLPYLILAAWIIRALSRAKTDFKVLTVVLNTIGGIFVLGNIAYINYHEVRLAPMILRFYAQQDADVDAMKLDVKAKKPDIYYIVLDAMGRHDTLEEFYKFDNSAFISGLEKRGFVVPKYSRSNYPCTCLSLPSSLNMDYLNYPQKEVSRKSTDCTLLYRLTQRNKVALALKRLNYNYINVSSGYSPTDYVPEADVNLGFPFGNIFHIALARSTLLGPLQRDFDFLANAARAVRLYPFENIEKIVRQPAPKFVLIHIVVPHPPFLFKEDGSRWELDRISFSEGFEKTRYIEQVKFIQNKTIALLDEMDKDSKEKIIILQGDHGPAVHHPCKEVHAAEAHPYVPPSPSEIRLRLSIFNAYRFPGIDKSKIYDHISPVNTFRFVFNEYFNSNMKILPDECFYAPPGLPYDLINVTKALPPDLHGAHTTASQGAQGPDSKSVQASKVKASVVESAQMSTLEAVDASNIESSAAKEAQQSNVEDAHASKVEGINASNMKAAMARETHAVKEEGGQASLEGTRATGLQGVGAPALTSPCHPLENLY